MPSTRSRLRVARNIALVSVDVCSQGLATAAARRTIDTTGRLIEMVRRYRLPVTWAALDPLRTAELDAAASLDGEQEVALLFESDGRRGTSRAAVADLLRHRVASARAAGCPVSSLVPLGRPLDGQFDLLSKHQISAMRGAASARAKSAAAVQPSMPHYGVWEIPVSLCMPQARRTYGNGVSRRVRRRPVQGHVFHWVIDAAELADAGFRGTRTVEGVMRQLAIWRDSGRIELATLRTLAARLSHTPRQTPARSVLRLAG